MPFNYSGDLRYYQFSSLLPYSLSQGVFTRQGGVSPDPWDSLNLGGTVGDEPSRVQENKRRLLQAMQRTPDSLFEVWQVHGANILKADRPAPFREKVPRADAVITENPQVTLLMRFADCVPIYFYDPDHKAIGMAHAGWKGTIKHIARKTVEHMKRHYRTDPTRLMVGIGPSIGPDHYHVGQDVSSRVQNAFPESYHQLIGGQHGKQTFNLWEANRQDLLQAGVKHIEVAELCTACHPQDWYTHRGENGNTGRFGALFALR